ncbi:MAG: ribosome maturation factor RimP [Synergistaceae bacterium]|nr:ribosome maturation factor RimP [Synergistaceae bacterium]
MNDRENSKKLKETLREMTESCGLVCYWIDFSESRPHAAKVLRVYIDKAGGVGHAECEVLSRRINEYLDSREAGEYPWLEKEYYVEVSSPGIERPLFTLEHYGAALGRRALVFTKNSKKYEGTLVACDSGSVTVEADDGARQAIPFSDVKKGNLVFLCPKGEKKGGGRQKKDKAQEKN